MLGSFLSNNFTLLKNGKFKNYNIIPVVSNKDNAKIQTDLNSMSHKEQLVNENQRKAILSALGGLRETQSTFLIFCITTCQLEQNS